MAWSAPVSPVSGTVITVAWATANVVNPLAWLRLMTGNADPPGSNYVVVSSSTTVTVWDKVKHDTLAATEQLTIGMQMAWLGTPGSIPLGWSRNTIADGRFLVGVDGATFAASGNTGGSATATVDAHTHGMKAHTHTGPSHQHDLATHTHTMSSHTHDLQNHSHSVPSLSVGITSGAETSDNGLGNNGGVSTPSVGHQHVVSGGTGTGTSGIPVPNNTGGPDNNTSGGPSNNTSGLAGTGATGAPSDNTTTTGTSPGGNISILPPWYAVLWIYKSSQT